MDHGGLMDTIKVREELHCYSSSTFVGFNMSDGDSTKFCAIWQWRTIIVALSEKLMLMICTPFS